MASYESDEDLKSILLDGYISHKIEERNKKLQDTDKYLLPDFDITQTDLDKMKRYRKYLRDLGPTIRCLKYKEDIDITTFENFEI
jgi:hypothetical protein